MVGTERLHHHDTVAFDFRAGGVWRFVMHGPDGRDYQNRITFDEIVPPERIVYRHGGGDDVEPVQFTQTVTFEDLGNGKTRLTWHGMFPSAEERERVIKEYGADKGLVQTMARLADYVAAMAKPENAVMFDAALSDHDQRAQRVAQVSALVPLTSRSVSACVCLPERKCFGQQRAAGRGDASVGGCACPPCRSAIFTRRRRSSGLRLAVSVVRSMASRAATLPMLGGSGRLSDISSENCPCVRSSGAQHSRQNAAPARAPPAARAGTGTCRAPDGWR